MHYSFLRSTALLVIAGLVQQLAAAPYTSPLARLQPADNVREEAQAELAAEREAAAERKVEAVEYLRGAPLTFEENHGQFPEAVGFAAQSVGAGAYLSPAALTLAVPLPKEEAPRAPTPGNPDAPEPVATRHTAVTMRLLGADVNAAGAAESPVERVTNYYRGPGRVEQGVRHYERVRYSEVYPQTDLVYYGVNGALEYDFELEAGADPAAIALRFEGVEALRLDEGGDLLLATAAGEVRQSRPVAYQELDGERVLVEARFRTADARTVGFELGAYDRTRPLVIDPKIFYATGLGGPGDDFASKIEVDENDDVFLSGTTTNPAWTILSARATAEDAEQATPPRFGFVLRLERIKRDVGDDSYRLAASTFLGDGAGDTSIDAIDYHDGAIYATGVSAASLPTTDGPVEQSSGVQRAFLAVFAATVLSLRLLRTYGANSHGTAISVIDPGGGAAPVIAMAVLFFGTTFLGHERGAGRYGAALLALALATGLLLSSEGFYQTTPNATMGITALFWTIVAGVVQIGIIGAADGAIMSARGSLGGGWGGFIAHFTMTTLGILALAAVLMLGGAGDEFMSGGQFLLIEGVLAVIVLVISSSRTLFGISSQASIGGFNSFIGVFNLATFALLTAWGILGAGNVFGAGLSIDRWGHVYCGLQVESIVTALFLVTAAGVTLARFTTIGEGVSLAELFHVGVLKFALSLATLTMTVFYAVILLSAVSMAAQLIAFDNWGNPLIAGYMAAPGFLTTPNALQGSYIGGFDMFLIMLTAPLIFATSVLNGASFRGGFLAPCAIVSVFGHGIGPKQLALFELVDGLFPTVLGGVRLLINGVAQSLIFTSKEQLSAVVDCDLGASPALAKSQGAEAEIIVEVDGVASNAVSLPVVAADPALFTVAQTGQGKTATLNQDGSVNTAANPAPVGSTVALFGTGGGATDPFCDSSGLASSTELMPTATTFAATVAAQEATLVFSGASPGLTCGLNQWNVTVPGDLTADDANADPEATTICVETADGAVIDVAVEILATQ